ncbi:hypothetical protein QQ045_002181 [Rhodiola kirilowii]
MLTHILGTLPTPITVITRLTSLMSNFLWNQKDEKRHHWVGWNQICRPKDAGGLGIRSLNEIKQAFQHKLAWRCMESSALWGRYIRARYKHGERGSHMWTALSKILPDMKSQVTWFVGEGKITLLDFCWIYKAHPPDNLKWVPLHDILSDPDLLAEALHNLPTPGRTELELASLSNDPDRLCWARSTDGRFSTKAFRRCLGSPMAHHKILAKAWHSWLPPRISVFIWRLHLQALSTDDNISQCGIPFPSKCRCCASPDVETLHHIFLDSDLARQIWTTGHRLFDIRPPLTVRMLWFLWFQQNNISTYLDGVRLLWVCSSLWEIWKSRNHAIHATSTYDLLGHITAWMLRVAPIINLPHTHNFCTALTLKALHLRTPYTPKPKWSIWIAHPTGLTLNIAWQQTDSGLIGAFVLRNQACSVVWLHVDIVPNILGSLSDSLRTLHGKNQLPAAIQSCHPTILDVCHRSHSLPLQAQTRQLLRGIEVHRICKGANSAVLALANSFILHPPADPPDSLSASVRHALRSDNLRLPSICGNCHTCSSIRISS